MPTRKLLTDWGKQVDGKPLQEYPRPQLVRKSYINLNGWWEYAITDTEAVPQQFHGKILVPFSPESALSGVDKVLKPKEYLFYRRTFTLGKGFVKDRVLLNFGAVDSLCDVFVNGQLACHHEGGYNAFTADITEFLRAEENELVVRVRDLTDTSFCTRGKQSLKSGGMWYTPQSGIWQTVWMESVPAQYIKSVHITPDFDNAAVTVQVTCSVDEPVTVVVLDDHGSEVAKNDGRGAITVRFPNREFVPWTPENPYLYGLRLISRRDRVESYFGMRKFSCSMAGKYPRLMLNNRPYFHNGLLDQGYWPDGLYTAPSDEAMIFDISTAKSLGFNMLRKHVKVEPARWYYHCDRLGMLVWQDMPNGGTRSSKWTSLYAPYVGIGIKDKHYRRMGRKKQESRDAFLREYTEMIDQLYNCVSIAMWVPFNEGWGQFDANKIATLTKQMDPTRTVDHASGWHDQGGGDVHSIHLYMKKLHLPKDKQRAVCLTEFGGYSLRDPAHSSAERTYGYKLFSDEQQYNAGVMALYEQDVVPWVNHGLSAAVYTQLTDVEEEVNGLLTCDRKVLKIHADMLREINSRLNLHRLAELLEQSKYRAPDEHVPHYSETV